MQTPTENEDTEERRELMEEWERNMADFIPDDLITFQLPAGEEEVVFEEITLSTTIRGVF